MGSLHNQCFKSQRIIIKDVNYIIKNDEAVIVDEFTGRVMPGRRWSDGQHRTMKLKRILKFSLRLKH